MAGGWLRPLLRAVTRKKVYYGESLENSDLKRCLSLWDMVALGAGSSLGAGVFVLVGGVAVQVAGPAVVLSFLIAAVVATGAGLCYAEFSSRVPRAGSAYTYTYVAVGELAAFVVGWNMLLEGVFSTASLARGLSVYVDSITNYTMSQSFESVAPIHSEFFSTHFDFFSFFLVLVFGAVMSWGVRESSIMNIVFTGVSMLTIMFIIFVGAFKANLSNWRLDPIESGDGGFFPHGAVGVLQGAAYCFYGYMGFDAIAVSAQEVHQPRSTIPKAILLVLLISCLSYVGVATVVTMMVPYYEQESMTAVAMVFSQVGWNWAMWIVQVGAIFSILASLFGAMFPLPRILYAMAEDGLMCQIFSKISKRQSPVIGTLIPTTIIAVLSATFRLEQLVLMLCIGTLLSYTAVAASVVLTRYHSDEVAMKSASTVRQLFGLGTRTATRLSSNIVTILLSLYVCVCVAFSLVYSLAWSAGGGGALGAVAAILLAGLALQPQQDNKAAFMTPLVPLVPCLSIACNIFLMVLIDAQTWFRVLIWILIGIPVYIICMFVYRRKKFRGYLVEGVINQAFSHTDINSKSPIQITVEQPTPPTYRKQGDEQDDNQNRPLSDEFKADIKELNKVVKDNITMNAYTIETIELQSVIGHNDEKEATIIDLLDQVLRAEEDSFEESFSITEDKVVEEITIRIDDDSIPHRKSLSELSDADSDASLTNQGLSQYDVVAQVHREDLPKVDEEIIEEEKETNTPSILEEEPVTFFNESETSSRTDESGYSDTTDNNHLVESTEELKQDIFIPPPPPFDESLFAKPQFQKSYTLASRPKSTFEEVAKPRESVQSNDSYEDDTIIFGSARQTSFAHKLSGILTKQMAPGRQGNKAIKRSNSTGNVTESSTVKATARPIMMLELQKEILGGDMTQLRRTKPVEIEKDDDVDDDDDDNAEESMSRVDLKNKLESIFANGGGTQLVKPRLMKSNPPTPEDSPKTESVTAKITAKIEKSDTLKLQKAKFGDVLNSFRLSLNKDDQI